MLILRRTSTTPCCLTKMVIQVVPMNDGQTLRVLAPNLIFSAFRIFFGDGWSLLIFRSWSSDSYSVGAGLVANIEHSHVSARTDSAAASLSLYDV